MLERDPNSNLDLFHSEPNRATSGDQPSSTNDSSKRFLIIDYRFISFLLTGKGKSVAENGEIFSVSFFFFLGFQGQRNFDVLPKDAQIQPSSSATTSITLATYTPLATQQAARLSAIQGRKVQTTRQHNPNIASHEAVTVPRRAPLLPSTHTDS